MIGDERALPLLRASARLQIARVDFVREVERSREVLDERDIAGAVSGAVAPRESLPAAQFPAPRPGFSGGSVEEIALRNLAGELEDAETVRQLAAWDYLPDEEMPRWNEASMPSAGRFAELLDLVNRGLISEELFQRISAARRAGGRA